MPQDWLEALAPLGTDWHKEFLETAPYLIVVFRVDSDVVKTVDGEKRILARTGNERPFVLIPVGLPARDATVPAITSKALDEVMEIK